MRSASGLSEGTSAHLPTPAFPPQELHHKNRYWHEDCFRCAKCYKSLASEAFSARDDGKIMCGKCGSREDGNRCQGCYKVVMPGGFAPYTHLFSLKSFHDIISVGNNFSIEHYFAHTTTTLIGCNEFFHFKNSLGYNKVA